MFAEYPDVLRVADAALALGIGKNAMYKLIHDGSVGTIKVGKTILVPKICLMDFVLSARINSDTCNSRQSGLSLEERSSHDR